MLSPYEFFSIGNRLDSFIFSGSAQGRDSLLVYCPALWNLPALNTLATSLQSVVQNSGQPDAGFGQLLARDRQSAIVIDGVEARALGAVVVVKFLHAGEIIDNGFPLVERFLRPVGQRSF